MVGEVLVEDIARIPTMRWVQTRRLDQLAFRVDAFEEHDDLQLEEDGQVDGRPSPLGVEGAYPLTHE
jgi:hypothetical protein